MRGRITLGRVTDPYVPIVPGGSPPTLSQMMPAPVVKPRRRWLAPTLIAATIVIVGTGIAAGAWYFLSGDTALEQASQQCAAGELGDGGNTLFVDTVGTGRASGTDTTSDLACVLNALQTPDYVVHAMEQTSALNGRQTEEWGDFSASWTFHPENGLDVLIREK